MFIHDVSLSGKNMPFHFLCSPRKILIACALGLLLLPSGCTATGATQRENAFHQYNGQLAPSLRAEMIFAQLKLNRAVRCNDHDAILEAADTLLSPNAQDYRLTVSHSILDAAVWLLKHKHEGEVIPFLQKASAVLPDDLALISLQADLLSQEDHQDLALTLIQNFADAHPKDFQAQAELAIMLLRNAQQNQALQVFQRIPEKHRTPPIRFSYAQALNISRQYAEAEHQLRLAVQDEPEYAEAWQLLALTLEEQKKIQEALGIYTKLLETDPENKSARLFLLRLQLRMKDHKAALETLTGAQDTVRFAVTAIAMLMEEKQFDQADRLLQQLEQIKDMPSDLYFYHAALLYENGEDFDRALELLSKVSPSSQEYDKVLRLRVRILYELKHFSEALKVLEPVRAMHPDDIEPLLMTAELYCIQKKYAEAEQILAEVTKRAPDNEYAAFQAAYLKELQGDRKLAMSLMEEVIKQFPDNALALNYVGYNLADTATDLDRALSLLEHAVKLEPEADFILDSLAWVHYRRGELEEAWKMIQDAVQHSPDPTMLEHYGDIAAALHKTAESHEGWSQALKIYQTMEMHEEAARVRSKLEKK